MPDRFPMKHLMMSTAALAALLTTACTTPRAVYQDLQFSERVACGELPPSQYEACMERATKSYEEYEREREAVLRDQPRGYLTETLL